jgi:hypothetical protein
MNENHDCLALPFPNTVGGHSFDPTHFFLKSNFIFLMDDVELSFVTYLGAPSCPNEFRRYFFHVLLPSNTIQKMPRFFSIWIPSLIALCTERSL